MTKCGTMNTRMTRLVHKSGVWDVYGASIAYQSIRLLTYDLA